jgi:hypothetical protein
MMQMVMQGMQQQQPSTASSSVGLKIFDRLAQPRPQRPTLTLEDQTPPPAAPLKDRDTPTPPRSWTGGTQPVATDDAALPVVSLSVANIP